jgi:hypothetical protein
MNIDQRFDRLERQNRRLRLAVVGLGALVGLGILGGMTAAAPDELTLQKLTLVDAEGNPRILLTGTTAQISHYDKHRTMRIATGIPLDGSASMMHLDKNGTPRINVGTAADGGAAVLIADTEGRPRIRSGTNADGSASVTRVSVLEDTQ